MQGNVLVMADESGRKSYVNLGSGTMGVGNERGSIILPARGPDFEKYDLPGVSAKLEALREAKSGVPPYGKFDFRMDKGIAGYGNENDRLGDFMRLFGRVLDGGCLAIVLAIPPPRGTGRRRRRLESKGDAFGQAAEGGREKALPFHSGTRGRGR
jgi:hypothetical protein